MLVRVRVKVRVRVSVRVSCCEALRLICGASEYVYILHDTSLALPESYLVYAMNVPYIMI